MIDKNLLLYIEPRFPATKEPVIDSLTRKMTGSFRNAVAKGIVDSGGKFRPGGGYRGWHECICKARSSNVEYLLPGGEITNSLCIHYLSHHRDEVPREQLERVAQLPAGEVAPETDELKSPIDPDIAPKNRYLRYR